MRRTIIPIVNAALLALLIALPFFAPPYYVELIAKILVFAIFAMSLDLLIGFTGLVSFGHAAFFGIAAYALALLTPQAEAVSLWLVLPVAVIAAAIGAFVIGIFVLRTRGVYFIMVTLAFAQMVFSLFQDTKIGGGSDGVFLGSRPDATLFGFTPFDLTNGVHAYYFVVAMLVLTFLLLQQVLRSPFGRVLVGIKSNEHRMRSLGYATYLYKLGAFTLAGALAGVAGFCHAVLFAFVNPELLSWHRSGDAILMVILGGMGSLGGAIAGAFAFVAMQEFFSQLTKHWLLLMGTAIVLTVLFLPGGLAAVPDRIRRALQRGGADG
ncbi:MAG: branched-chain amino acid ABC transporter permease [Gemmatimonadota bacterium]